MIDLLESCAHLCDYLPLLHRSFARSLCHGSQFFRRRASLLCRRSEELRTGALALSPIAPVLRMSPLAFRGFTDPFRGLAVPFGRSLHFVID